MTEFVLVHVHGYVVPANDEHAIEVAKAALTDDIVALAVTIQVSPAPNATWADVNDWMLSEEEDEPEPEEE